MVHFILVIEREESFLIVRSRVTLTAFLRSYNNVR